MKDLSDNHKYRVRHPTMGWGDHEGGYFEIPEKKLRIIASNGGGWDHVSVSLVDRCPTWDEMEFVKRLFFKDDEVAVEIHPALKNYRSAMPYCLHLFRPQKVELPLPPTWMVAP
jgi:hypothetical protein